MSTALLLVSLVRKRDSSILSVRRGKERIGVGNRDMEL